MIYYKNMNNKNTIFIGIAVIVLIILAALTVINKSDTGSSADSSGNLVVLDNNFDLGVIPIMGGKVSHIFELKNEGEGPVKIKKVYTSCMCTEARITISDKNYGPYGMPGHGGQNSSADIKAPAGESMFVKAVFNPLAHGPDAIGEILREVYLETDSKETPKIVLKFKGDVVKEIPRVSGPSLYILKMEYDFGVVKQSQGIVSADFEIINNGSEKVVVSSLPTSCACASAKINKKEIAAGEKAVITVSFDPNLHEEPEGRFFKTIEIISNIKPAPQLKIYAEIDYDLGLDKLKNKTHDN